jgi:hypothetical protein
LNNPLKYSDPSGMLAKARDEEDDAAFDAYFSWLCDANMSFGNMFGGGGGYGASVDGAAGWDRDASSSRMNGVRWNGLGYVDRLTGDPVSYNEVFQNYIVPGTVISASGDVAQGIVASYLDYSVSDPPIGVGGMPPPQRPDLGILGNAIRDHAGSDFGKDLFEHYWQGTQSPWTLSLDRFIDVVTYAAKNGADNLQGKLVTLSTGETVIAKNINFYSSFEYSKALGNATIYYDRNNNPVGFFDTYDFNWGNRPFSAEWKTRAVSIVGPSYNAKPFVIRFP